MTDPVTTSVGSAAKNILSPSLASEMQSLSLPNDMPASIAPVRSQPFVFVAYTKCIATVWHDRIYCVAYTKCVATLWHDRLYLFVHVSRVPVTWSSTPHIYALRTYFYAGVVSTAEQNRWRANEWWTALFQKAGLSGWGLQGSWYHPPRPPFNCPTLLGFEFGICLWISTGLLSSSTVDLLRVRMAIPRILFTTSDKHTIMKRLCLSVGQFLK